MGTVPFTETWRQGRVRKSGYQRIRVKEIRTSEDQDEGNQDIRRSGHQGINIK